MTAKTPAERVAASKARRVAAGLVQFKTWAHPEDVPALRDLAAKLARKRSRITAVGIPRE